MCQIIFALLYHLPFILWFGLDHLNSQNGLSVLYAGIFPSIIAPLVWMLAVQYLGPNRTSIFMNLMPVFHGYHSHIFGWQKCGGVITVSVD